MRILLSYLLLFRAIIQACRTPRVQALGLICMLIALLQALVFSLIEGWGLVDAFYFAVVSMATVGYGDLAPETRLGKLLAIGFLMIGIGVFVLTVSSIAQVILKHLEEGEARNDLIRRRSGRK
ncbi:potassium channel family protein [Paracoccus sp. MBLB3053]|uniref:Potassium channel family protein n=1 Tax=Paracoccus aurantius TaxID=3073814 RepID=A0ABU2HY36_9RHOB|nr:potassium channel family protein [Paracoccus sp. MBLB3053]MDS9469973.1 potassium channel family protein [Paracoccus sp. MBLB3053]